MPSRGLIAALITCALVPTSALAFECTMSASKAGDPVTTQVWRDRCIPYAINDDTVAALGDGFTARVRASFDRWQNETCSDL